MRLDSGQRQASAGQKVSAVLFEKQKSDEPEQDERRDLPHFQDQQSRREAQRDEPGDASIARDAAIETPKKVRSHQQNGHTQDQPKQMGDMTWQKTQRHDQ